MSPSAKRLAIVCTVITLAAVCVGGAWFFCGLLPFFAASSSLPTASELAAAERLVDAATVAYEDADAASISRTEHVFLKPCGSSLDIIIYEATNEPLQNCLIAAMRRVFPGERPSPRPFRVLFFDSKQHRKLLRTELLPPSDRDGP